MCRFKQGTPENQCELWARNKRLLCHVLCHVQSLLQTPFLRTSCSVQSWPTTISKLSGYIFFDSWFYTPGINQISLRSTLTHLQPVLISYYSTAFDLVSGFTPLDLPFILWLVHRLTFCLKLVSVCIMLLDLSDHYYTLQLQLYLPPVPYLTSWYIIHCHDALYPVIQQSASNITMVIL